MDTPTPPPPISPEPPLTGSYQRPADYYSQTPPPGTGKKGCPKWVPIGCGAAGCLVLILLAVGGWFVVSKGGRVLHWAFGQIQKDLGTFYAPDVTPEQRAALEGELTQLRTNISEGKVEIVRLQPILQDMQSSVADRSLSRSEVEDLTAAMKEVNSTSKR